MALQVVQVPVWVPAAENVPAAQEAMTVLDVEVQAVVMRWPAVATVQAAQVEAVSAALFALYVPAPHCVQAGLAALVLL